MPVGLGDPCIGLCVGAVEPPIEEGTGASPSSAIRERYSLSILALSCADWGSPGRTGTLDKNVNVLNKRRKLV